MTLESEHWHPVLCFWCEQPRPGEEHLDAAAEAGKPFVVDYLPCPTCARLWAQGIVIVEADATPWRPDMFPICPDATGAAALYPTGRFAVLSPTAVRAAIPGVADALIRQGRGVLQPLDFRALLETSGRTEATA